MSYRGEIDGLRAIAVTAVILNHAGIALFSGGFVGVDVFFVISGYLITAISIGEVETGRFSIQRFYERRARRILPALFVVMAACLPFAWAWLMPSDMTSFLHSVIATSLFASNVLFWRTSGYFEPAAEVKPLIHTWSLGVEEQFYILFPLMLFVWRQSPRRSWALFVAISLVSLGGAPWGATYKPGAAFYLLPTRAWELLSGALVAIALHNGLGRRIPRIPREIMACGGVALLVLSILAYDKNTPFPSLYTLLPVGATAAIIFCAKGGMIASRLLAAPPLVAIGLVSYSTYLWHQPVLAFARHSALLDTEQPVTIAALCLLSFALAFLTWRYVELPFRKMSGFGGKKLAATAALASLLFISFGVAGHVSRGFAGRLGPDQDAFLGEFKTENDQWQYVDRNGIVDKYRLDCNFQDITLHRRGTPSKLALPSIPKDCYTRSSPERKTIFLWGDSHLQHLSYGIRRTLPVDWQVLQIAGFGCPAIASWEPNPSHYCNHGNWFAFKIIRESPPDVVLLAHNTYHVKSHMDELSKQLFDVGVKKVVFVGPTPHWKPELPVVLAHRLWDRKPARTFVGVNRRFTHLNERLKAETKGAPYLYVSPIDYFCNGEGCLIYLDGDWRSGITSWDYGHLTPPASERFARDVLAPIITR